MQNTREFRKATSFVAVLGSTFRLTTAFKTNLAMLIEYAQGQPVTTTYSVQTSDGKTPMSLSELYQLRDAIAAQYADAVATNFTAQGGVA